METIKTDKLKLKINGIGVNAEVKIKIDQDEWPDGDFDFGNAEDNARYLKRFETGELVCVRIVVEVSAEGEMGIDSLGMCHVKAQSLEGDVLAMVKDHQMIEQAAEDLRKEITSKAKRLFQFAGGES